MCRTSNVMTSKVERDITCRLCVLFSNFLFTGWPTCSHLYRWISSFSLPLEVFTPKLLIVANVYVLTLSVDLVPIHIQLLSVCSVLATTAAAEGCACTGLFLCTCRSTSKMTSCSKYSSFKEKCSIIMNVFKSLDVFHKVRMKFYIYTSYKLSIT